MTIESMTEIRRLTDAPKSYDSFGTWTVRIWGIRRGALVREVAIKEEHLEWQDSRYWSGCHVCLDPDDCRRHPPDAYGVFFLGGSPPRADEEHLSPWVRLKVAQAAYRALGAKMDDNLDLGGKVWEAAGGPMADLWTALFPELQR